MKKTLFITGGSGFIGRNLLNAINFEDYDHIYCLGRKESETINQYSTKSNFTFLKGDISEPESYARFIQAVDIVVHLAALTGKAASEEYLKVNCEGTKHLLEMSGRHGVEKFIFISSIAADFRNIEGYHYAQSKIEAEHAVMNSGLSFTILRPTIVTGVGASILNSFLQLAKAPVVPIFGDGRVKIQPVYIDDLVRCILYAVQSSALHGRTVTVAGPEQITIEAFIKALHGWTGGKKFRVIHLPVGPIRKILLMLERKFLKYLPFTAGQLCTFTNDGIADANPCTDVSNVRLKGVDEMLRLSLSPVGQRGRTAEELEKECELLTNYLIGRTPDDYVKGKYVKGNRVTAIEKDLSPFDTVLIKAANKNLLLLKLADAYTSILYKNSAVRKKLLLALAILESSESTYLLIDTVEESPAAVVYARLSKKTAVFLFTFIIAVIVFTPVKLISSFKNGPENSVKYE